MKLARSVADAGELAAMAPVGRELMLLPRDQQRSVASGPRPARTSTIDNLPANFSGRLTMRTPEYLVEVSARDDRGDRAASTARFGEKTMISLDSGIRLQAREFNYACVTGRQLRLGELITMPANRLPRIVRVVDRDEVSETVHARIAHF